MEKEFISALHLTYENAKSLFEEAEILHNNLKSTRAYTLYHFCYEECGRFFLIYKVFMEYVNEEISRKKLNIGTLKKLGYNDHEMKITECFHSIGKYAFANLYMKSGHSPDSDFDNLLKNETKELENAILELQKNKLNLNTLKNKSLYITFDENKFQSPDDVIKLREYRYIQKIANIGLKFVEGQINFAESKGGFSKYRQHIKKTNN